MHPHHQLQLNSACDYAASLRFCHRNQVKRSDLVLLSCAFEAAKSHMVLDTSNSTRSFA